MSFDGIFSQEAEKKRKKIEEKKQLSREVLDIQKKKKAEISSKEETEKELLFLREAFTSGIIDSSSLSQVEEFAKDSFLDTKEFLYVCSLIDIIEQDIGKNHYIPESMRISQAEYKAAFYSLSQRENVLQRIDNILGVLLQHISPGNKRSLNMLGSLAFLLDKNLIFVQEAHIDMKRSLEGKLKTGKERNLLIRLFSFFCKN